VKGKAPGRGACCRGPKTNGCGHGIPRLCKSQSLPRRGAGLPPAGLERRPAVSAGPPERGRNAEHASGQGPRVQLVGVPETAHDGEGSAGVVEPHPGRQRGRGPRPGVRPDRPGHRQPGRRRGAGPVGRRGRGADPPDADLRDGGRWSAVAVPTAAGGRPAVRRTVPVQGWEGSALPGGRLANRDAAEQASGHEKRVRVVGETGPRRNRGGGVPEVAPRSGQEGERA
jgi:hypothetical protein